MAVIRVHILNFHSIFSGLQLILENRSHNPYTYFEINRWEKPKSMWSYIKPDHHLKAASSVFTFDINLNPDDIACSWNEYYQKTHDDIKLTGNNCAVATQWFLSKFVGIPKPDNKNLSINHLAFGIFWPSFIPCPVTLPGRVFSNAKFHIKARQSNKMHLFAKVFLYISLGLLITSILASLTGIAIASSFLGGGIAALAVLSCLTTSGISTGLFFKTYNKISANNVRDKYQQTKSEYSSNLNSIPINSLLDDRDLVVSYS